MSNLITKDEVVNMFFNRNVDSSILKSTMIELSSFKYLNTYLGDLYNDIIENENGDYTDFIEDYIKPVLSWAVLYDNFEYITLNITDKGIIQMVVEGTANLIGHDARYDFKMEIKRNLFSFIHKMQNKALKEKEDNNELFKNYNPESRPSLMTFREGNIRFNIRPY